MGAAWIDSVHYTVVYTYLVYLVSFGHMQMIECAKMYRERSSSPIQDGTRV